MTGSLHSIQLVEIIGPNTVMQQFFHKPVHGLLIIVDPFEQDRLGTYRNAGISQLVTCMG